MKRNRKVLCWMLRAMALCLPLSEVLAEPPAASSDGSPAVVLSVEAGALSARVRDAPLKQVLEALARHVPLEVYYTGAVGEQKVTDVFERLPLEEGIKRILKNTSHILSYSEAVPAQDGRASARKMEIRIATSDSGSLNSAQQTAPLTPKADQARDRLLRDLIHKALHGAEPKDRVAALNALKKEFKEEEVLPTFIDALKDTDMTVRKLALSLIGAAKERVPITTIAEIGLNQKEDRRVRSRALFYLGRRYLGESTGVLEKALDDPDKLVSHRAKFLLKMIATGITHEDMERMKQEEAQKEAESEKKDEELAKKSLEQAEQIN